MLKDALQQMAATGEAGFEGLIQRLLGRLTGYQYYLAQSGSQSGRDLASERINATVVAVECKRYGDETELKIPELLGKLAQAASAIPRLDVWVLVASRPVSDQLYSALRDLGNRLHVDVQVLSAGDDFPSSLEVVCANGTDIVLSHLRASKASEIKNIERELERLAAAPEFSRRRDRLKAVFTTSAGYDATRLRLREWNLAQFSSPDGRIALGQVVDVESKRSAGLLVPRTQCFSSFDGWISDWSSKHTGLAVLGEEGDGKTWAVASWISATLFANTSLPPVLWIPSREVVETDVDVLMASALSKRLGGDIASWGQRLERWCLPSNSNHPALVLVLDGLNERHNANWWRPIVEGLGSNKWRQAVAPIVTARSGFWPALGRLPHITWTEWTVPPYNDEELRAALEQSGVTREHLPDEILALVRKPRYFDLAVRHRAVMSASGDVTVARLIYEDWRDREARRSGLPSEADFQTLIMELATRERRGPKNLATQDLLDSIGVLSNQDELLAELETGGILIREGRGWRVEPSRLALGFGLLLAERLLEAARTTSPTELLASLMEPQPDIDIKAAILENATLHSLKHADFTTEVRAALLAAWLTHRNPAHPTEQSVAAYFPLDPAAYLAAAESIWADSTNDGWAEELLRAAYARWSGLQHFAEDFRRAFERWLGFVHVDGSPVAIQPEDRSSRKVALSAILGNNPAPGPFEYAGTNLTAVEDEGLLRLGRVALSIISAEDRRPYARAITAAYVADALMQFPDKLDICRWIVRTAPHELWSSLKPEIDRLIRIGSRTTLQAAYRLLGSVGTAEALVLREALPDDLFPVPQWHRDHELDPCSSGFAWRLEHCDRCAARDDVPAHIMAQQLEKCVKNPLFRVPDSTCQRLSSLLVQIDPSRIWSGVFTSEQEHRFDTVEIALASCAPGALAATVRAIARDLPNRQGLSQRQLGHELLHYRLALTDAEGPMLSAAWDALRLRTSDEKEDERSEWSLFELSIDRLPAEEQLDRFLARRPEALLLTRFCRYFKPIAWSTISARLRGATEPRDIARLLIFASANPLRLDAVESSDLISCIGHSDSLIRFITLRLIYTCGADTAAAAVVHGDWHFKGSDDNSTHEDHWGSLVICRWGQNLPYEELRARVNPTHLGRAIVNRGLHANEIEQYARDLHHVWTQLATQSSTGEAPEIEVRIKGRSSTEELDLPAVPRSSFSRSITFRSRQASWGGAPAKISADIMKGPSDEDIQRLHDELGATISEQRRARNQWFAQRFSTDALNEVVDARPDLVREWIGDPIGAGNVITSRVWLARSFYEALCEVLLQKDPSIGVQLYDFLQKVQGAVHFVEHGTGISLLDYSLFEAPASGEVMARWDAYLDEAKSDRDLLVIATLARSEFSRVWLADRITADAGSDTPFRKVRAAVLQGFVEAATPPNQPDDSPHDVIEWQREQHERAVKNWKRDQWARTWFKKFASEDNDDNALGAFQLFLSCVDNRFSSWSGTATTDIRADRRRFFLTSLDRVERAIEKNEEDFKKYFLGMRIANRQVWPWN